MVKYLLFKWKSMEDRLYFDPTFLDHIYYIETFIDLDEIT